MNSIFSQLAATNAPAIRDTFGEPVVVTPYGGGDAVTVQGIVWTDSPEKSGATPRGMVNKVKLRILKSDYPTKPAAMWKFAIASLNKTFNFGSIENETDPIMWNLTLE